MAKNIKTNAMRILDKEKIEYIPYEYIPDENDLSGTNIANQVGLPFEIVFKTLVAKGDKTGPVVFCIPVDKEINLKVAASVTGNKKIEMVHVKDLLGLTGYIRGGCSPIGMKKKFPTYINETAKQHEKITVSAGIKGCQLLLKVDDIVRITNATLCNLIN
ncbi:MAG: Cys-tRNA(Pro) deacylase [Ruminococcaceae bacterium]|nr:Cys-tRNA(Pro) deacylase [Oscillospiraceae bacterium]